MSAIVETTTIDHLDFTGDILSSKTAQELYVEDPLTGIEVRVGGHITATEYAGIALVYLLTNPNTEFELPQETSERLKPGPSRDEIKSGKYLHKRWVPLLG